jgi:hypothetical protein
MARIVKIIHPKYAHIATHVGTFTLRERLLPKMYRQTRARTRNDIGIHILDLHLELDFYYL